jgi:hypothetical protein
MPIYISQTSEPNRFVNPQLVHTKTGDGKELVVLSGIVHLNLKGLTSSQWLRDKVSLSVNLGPVLLADKGFRHEQAACLVTINSMFNKGASTNAGYAVDTCSVKSAAGFSTGISIDCDVAVRDSDAWLYRIGYHVTLVGTFGDLPIIK